MTENAPIRILTVDDDVDTCRNLADILEDCGYDVETAHGGVEALEILEQRPCDVALLDLKMPGMDGLELYREIKRRQPEIVAVIVSAHASEETAQEAVDAGVWQVLPKPVDIARLLGLVQEAAGQPLVLVVDDDRDMCQSLWDVLRQSKYRVGLAHDRNDVERVLDGRPFDVVLIDVRLPDTDGGEVFEMVGRRMPEARVVVVTGYRSEAQAVVDRLQEEGADAVFYKPLEMDRLLSRMRDLVARR